MDLEIVETVFTFGKFAALSPSSTKNHNPHWFQKLYEILVFVVYVVGFVVTSYINKQQYQFLTSMQLVLAIFTDLNQFCHVFYILIVMMRFRRSLWFRLIETLATVKSTSQKYPFKLIFVVLQLVYFFLCFCGVYSGVQYAGLSFVSYSVLQWYQHYIQFFYLVVTSAVLILILSKYQSLSETLSQVIKTNSQLRSRVLTQILKKIRNNIFTLKEVVEIFNEIFGWMILFNIFCCVSKSLNFLDILIKMSGRWTTWDALLVYSEACCILIAWVIQSGLAFRDDTPFCFQTGILSTTLLCDSILRMGEEILLQAYRLQTAFTSYGIEEILVFIDVVRLNRPEFTAARFFSIDRSTLFCIINSLTTFLLVMVQFTFQ
jgi:gustatory receptor